MCQKGWCVRGCLIFTKGRHKRYISLGGLNSYPSLLLAISIGTRCRCAGLQSGGAGQLGGWVSVWVEGRSERRIGVQRKRRLMQGIRRRGGINSSYTNSGEDTKHNEKK